MESSIHFDITPEELKQDHDKLERFIDEYKTLRQSVEHSPLPFSVYDSQGRILLWNEAYITLHQQMIDEHEVVIEAGKFKYEDLIRACAPSDLTDEEIEEHIATYKEVQNRSHGKWMERQYPEHGWYKIQKYTLPNGSVAGIGTDINALKNKQSELEASNSQAEFLQDSFREAVSVLDDGFVIYDEDDRLILCNGSFTDEFGEGASFFKEGSTFREIAENLVENGNITAQQGDAAQCVDELVAKRKFEEGTTDTFLRDNGQWIRQTTKRTAMGQLVGVCTDITELKEREFEIKKTSKRLQETIDAMAQGIIVFEDDKVIMFSENAKDLLVIDDTILFIGQTIDTFLDMQLEAEKFGTREVGVEYVGRHKKLIAAREPYRIDRTTVDGKHISVDGVPGENGRLILTFTNVTEEKNREFEFERTSQLLFETTAAMTQGMLVLNENEIEFFNQTAKDFLKLPEDILKIGGSWDAFLRYQLERGDYGEGQAGQDFYEYVSKGVKTRTPYEVERKTVDNKILKVNGVPSGTSGWLITFTDITNMRHREAELQTTSRLLLDTAEAMTQGIIVFGEDKIEFFNQRAKDLIQLPDEVLHIGGEWREILEYQRERGDFGDSEAAAAHVERVAGKVENQENFEFERTTLDGRTLFIVGAPTGSGGWLVTFSDITEIRQRDQQIATQTRLLQETTDAMIQGIVVFGKENIEFVNPQAQLMLDVPSELLSVGAPWRKYLEYQVSTGNYEAGVNIEEKYAQLLQDIEDGNAHQLERATKDGRTLRVDGAPNGVSGWIATYTDITELKNRERRLEEATKEAEAAERAKSEFLANMSHEIRTPMNGVMGMAELLATTELDPKQKMFTDVIVKSGASLLTIINDILDFSKIDAGQMQLDPAPFNLAEAIEDVATLVSSRVAEKDLELIVRIDPTLPDMIVGDVGRIRQIVTNLLGNAVKFTEKGHVYVNVDGAVDQSSGNPVADLRFTVEDTGIGIPKEKCAKVFQKFNQVDTSATRKHEGTGLGLSIASSLVELMHGAIGVESEFGAGSTFWFTVSLPVHAQVEKNRVIPGDLSGAKILIVDDNPVNRAILTEQMTSWHFDSAATASGEEALAVLKAVSQTGLSLDLVVLDYQMPGMCGADVLAEIRADASISNTPVLMLTSVDSSEVNQRLTELGVEGNLTKPTRSSMLLETVLQIVADSRARAGNVAGIQFVPADPPQPNVEPPIDVPLENPTDEPEAQEEPSSAEAASLEAETLIEQVDVLVAEDNEVNQIVVRQILEGTGVTFRIVNTGRLALETYKLRQPKMILMDVSMPEMNGKEATAAIREFEKERGLPAVPIVGVTAHALKGDEESCLEAGMDDYLSKPVSPNKMLEKIGHWLDKELAEAKSA